VCSVDVGSIGRTTYKLLSCDCVRVASQDPEEELAASNFPTEETCLEAQKILQVWGRENKFMGMTIDSRF
jgi:hypothetical protein